jgi:hypothetical protein
MATVEPSEMKENENESSHLIEESASLQKEVTAGSVKSGT